MGSMYPPWIQNWVWVQSPLYIDETAKRGEGCKEVMVRASSELADRTRTREQGQTLREMIILQVDVKVDETVT
jgi:hypothetical protein